MNNEPIPGELRWAHLGDKPEREPRWICEACNKEIEEHPTTCESCGELTHMDCRTEVCGLLMCPACATAEIEFRDSLPELLKPQAPGLGRGE